MNKKTQPTGEERYETPEILDIQPVTVRGQDEEEMGDSENTVTP